MGCRGWTRLALVGAALSVGACVAGGPSSRTSTPLHDLRAASPRYVFPLTGFGGYQWSGRVTEIGSSWRVPRIDAHSAPGTAATWVGAQSHATNQFIQVGVFERCVSPATIIYRAFWSDAALQYYPQWIGNVNAGDLVTASLVQGRGGWTATFTDASAGEAFAKAVAYGAGTSFTTGEWLQEDPIPSATATAVGPYPNMARVSFQRLQVAGGVPSLAFLTRLTLTTAGGFVLVPTGVRHDAFTFSARGALTRGL